MKQNVEYDNWYNIIPLNIGVYESPFIFNWYNIIPLNIGVYESPFIFNWYSYSII